MKIGDLVVRAYAYHAFIPGIIVGEYEEKVKHVGLDPGYYTNTIFVVMWSDNTQTTEMAEELKIYLKKNSGHNQ